MTWDKNVCENGWTSYDSHRNISLQRLCEFVGIVFTLLESIKCPLVASMDGRFERG